ncbi:hypothetical protein [Streptomyces alanosinicus]|uniref:Uncharacterized protein n=1 Tax=Streptomyces alanosinicus TaxID=68171 RepID=A0A918YNS9_9ACTN|nr:hypothetical protein [Streptomyces alanosinicus]GHE11033.1 hypothetical protein GCM10010339_69220 [Streptomyces alanosinicus]
MTDATALHTDNPVEAQNYIRRKLPSPTADTPAYAGLEQRRHAAALHRSFKSAWAAHARDQRGPQLPPHKVREPQPLPEKLIPGQRVEMIHPETGEIMTVIVPGQPEPEQEPKVNAIAVQLNAARSHCYEKLSGYARQLHCLEEAEDTDLVAEAVRQIEERKNTIKTVKRQSIQMRGYYDVLELAAAAQPRHPDITSVEEIIRAEKIDVRIHGLTYKKLREFLAAFAPSAAA